MTEQSSKSAPELEVSLAPPDPPAVYVCDQLGDVMNEEESQTMFRTFSDPGTM